MIKTSLRIANIPAILWGTPTDKLFIAVHGNCSNKEDTVIGLLAEAAVAKGYQVLSFDLPEHGERQDTPDRCTVQNCVRDLHLIMNYAQTLNAAISLFACSMGAYFSLLAYRDIPLVQSLFLSPVVNMERLIQNMLTWFQISAERLQTEKEIAVPGGQTLSWDYYCYVKDHPVERWTAPTAILYGSADTISEYAVVTDFARRFGCTVQVLEHGEHYFHTAEQLACYRQWLQETLSNG